MDTGIDIFTTGTGETALRVLEAHPAARAVLLDANPAILALARQRVPPERAESWEVRQLQSELPDGPFDLVVSALAVHHLDATAKRDLFGRLATVVRPDGRFVLADVVVPERPEDAVTPLEPGFDLPDRTSDLLAWLADAGFRAEIAWSSRDLAVIAATRL